MSTAKLIDLGCVDEAVAEILGKASKGNLSGTTSRSLSKIVEADLKMTRFRNLKHVPSLCNVSVDQVLFRLTQGKFSEIC